MQKPMYRHVSLNYSEILRTVGQYVDRSHLGDVRLIETEENLILQGTVLDGAKAGERVTYEITREDIEDIFHDAVAQRLKEIKG